MTFRVTMVVERPLSHERSTLVTRIAGCVDQDDAKRKARSLYHVIDIKKVEPVET